MRPLPTFLARLGACCTLPWLAACARPATVPPRATPVGDALPVLAAFDTLAERALWPGFDPRAVPLAIFDGARTWLIRHPHAPPRYAPSAAREGLLVREGRDSAVTANTSTTLGGVETATLLLDVARAHPAREDAAIAIHEAFHVFQRTRHPTWAANEALLFVYPVEQVDHLVGRRLETAALREALAATRRETAACWAGLAMEARAARYAALDSGSIAYERGSELNEGLANYVQARALDQDVVLPATDYPPDEIRRRSYAVGTAMAFLLDRLAPAWKDSLERGDLRALDEILTARLHGTTAHCGREGQQLAAERPAVQREAAAAVAALAERRARARAAFIERTGWTLVVRAPGAPLFPRGFDPLNVSRVSAHEVLHGRMVTLGNASGAVAVLGRASLSEGIGAHPLFEGVRTLTVTGLPAAPEARDSSGVLLLHGEGVTAQFRGARAAMDGRTITVVLPEPASRP